MASLSDESIALLEDHGYRTAAGGVDRKKLALDVIDLILPNTTPPNSGYVIAKVTPTALDQHAIMPAGFVSHIFGDQTNGLVAVMAHLTITSPHGAVQSRLPNGWVLGTGRVVKEMNFVQTDGTAIKKNVSCHVRYATKNKEVIKHYMGGAYLTRKDRQGMADAAFWAMIEKRQPALATWVNDELLPAGHQQYGVGLGVIAELEDGDDEE